MHSNLFDFLDEFIHLSFMQLVNRLEVWESLVR